MFTCDKLATESAVWPELYMYKGVTSKTDLLINEHAIRVHLTNE